MTNYLAKPSYTIPAGKTVSGTLEQARLVTVTCGRVWLTIEGQEKDFWLTAGESLNIPAKRLIVIEADQQASLVEMTNAHVTSIAQKIESASEDRLLTTAFFSKLSQKLKHHVFA